MKDSTRKNSGKQDAVSLLEADHRKVEKLFQKFEKSTNKEDKQALVKEVCTELLVHTVIEEEIFYPACKEGGVEESMMDEAQVEHDSAKIMIADLLKHDVESGCFDAKVKVLSEYIKHHVNEEEKPRSGIFAKARGKGVDLEGLGKEIMERKEELMAEGSAMEPSPPRTIDVSAVASAG